LADADAATLARKPFEVVMTGQNRAIPAELHVYSEHKRLEVVWQDGAQSRFGYELLRVECPCADCKGHTPDQAQVITGKQDVGITDFIPVGNYAIQMVFDDGHDSGLFSWDYLRQLHERFSTVRGVS